ncbi:hypothetical protein ABT075_21515 [Streptomyces sp. NPDC002677]
MVKITDVARHAGAELLMRKLGGDPDVPEATLLTPRLTDRTSTAPRPA